MKNLNVSLNIFLIEFRMKNVCTSKGKKNGKDLVEF